MTEAAYAYDEDCCGGHPDMSAYPDGCPVCGCREAGNASFTCLAHKTKSVKYPNVCLGKTAEPVMGVRDQGPH